MDKMSETANTAATIVKQIRKNGHAAYFAGGCVRDMLMGNVPADYDIATSAEPEQIMKMFDRAIPIGISFGVVNVIVNNKNFEIATFRADGKYIDGRRPDSVKFCDAKGDVKRRDFTINGMLYDPIENETLDFVGGREDIKNRIIRTIGKPEDRFNEDHLRLIRGARFAARLSFDIEPATKAAIKEIAPKILGVSAERICDELKKGLTAPNPHKFIDLLDGLNLLKEIMPEICDMKGVEQPENFHPEGDVYKHTLLCLSMMENPSWELAMSILLHDVAKPTTFCREINPDGSYGRIRFTMHEQIGAETAGKICKRLKASSYSIDRVKTLVKKHLRIKDAQNMRKSTLKRLFADPGYLELQELFRIDTLSSTKDLTAYEFCKNRFEELDEEQVKPKPLVNGHDLIEMGLKPGPIFSKILGTVVDEQLEEKIATREEALELVKTLIKDN